jgi:hypothetical protein
VSIISISEHDGIRLSRELLLKSAGYCVISAPSESVRIGDVPHDVQLVIIGQTVQGREALRLITAFREAHAHVRIMRIRRQAERAEAGCDALCFVEDGPATFLCCVSTLVKSGHGNDCRGCEGAFCQFTANPVVLNSHRYNPAK